jgi:ankyrin repeat protein
LLADHPESRDDVRNLFAAVAKGRTNVVRALLDAGVDVNARGEHGMTALHVAVGRPLDVVRELVERGASLNAREEVYGGTPTGRASWFAASDPSREISEVLDYLLDHTTDIFDLIEGGRVDQLARLLEKDPSLARARSPGGRTTLHALAEDTPFEDIIDLLLGHGAELDALDADGRTADDALANAGAPEIAALLRQKRKTRKPAP